MEAGAPRTRRKSLSTANLAEPTDTGVAVCAQGNRLLRTRPLLQARVLLRLPLAAWELLSHASGPEASLPCSPSTQPVAFSSVLPVRGLVAPGAVPRPCLTVTQVLSRRCWSLRQESAFGILENKKSCFPGVFFDGKPELCCLAARCPLKNIRQPLPASWRGRPVSTLCRGCRWGLQAACPGRGQDGAAVRGAVTNSPNPVPSCNSSTVRPLIDPAALGSGATAVKEKDDRPTNKVAQGFWAGGGVPPQNKMTWKSDRKGYGCSRKAPCHTTPPHG